MNKPALLMIPDLEKNVNRGLYLYACIEVMEAEGYEPVLPAFYDTKPYHQDLFFRLILEKIDVIFMFINFGTDARMLKIINDVSGNKKKIIYRRTANGANTGLFITPREVLCDVAFRMNIPVSDLKRKTRKREIVDARFIYFKRAKEITKASSTRIGKEVGKDHATVLHGILEVDNTYELKAKYEAIYGQTESEATTVEDGQGSCPESEIRRPVLPFRSMDPREQEIPDGKPFMQTLSGSGYRQPFSGYRSHNS